MPLWVCLEPERLDKTRRLLGCVAAGWKRPAHLILADPPDDGEPFIVWGQKWTALRAIPKALQENRPFYQFDNGYQQPGRGRNSGYYRITYRGLAPVLLKDPPPRANGLGISLKPWRKEGKHIVFALPGHGYGQSIGLDMPAWVDEMDRILPNVTDRPIIRRPKDSRQSLASHLHDAWALVTHSSNVAVDAVIAGVPVFVAPSSPAAPVGNLDFADLENPAMPEREQWINSLMCQQYTLQEMTNGLAFHFLEMVRKQVDG